MIEGELLDQVVGGCLFVGFFSCKNNFDYHFIMKIDKTERNGREVCMFVPM